MARRSSADTARELAILVRAKGDTLGGLAARANTTPLASPPPGPRGVAPPLRRSWPRRPRNRGAARSCDRVRLSDARNARSTNLVRSSRSVVNVGDAAAWPRPSSRVRRSRKCRCHCGCHTTTAMLPR